VASVAEHVVALVIPELVIIRLLIVAAEISVLVIGTEILQRVTTHRVLGLTASVNSPFLAVETPSK
jgi:hypothetical protein